MSRSILNVHGIGQATAAILAESGITSVDDLAEASVEQLVCLKGFNEVRAARIISDAKSMAASPAGIVANELVKIVEKKAEKKKKLKKQNQSKKEKKKKKKKSKKRKDKKSSKRKKKDKKKNKK